MTLSNWIELAVLIVSVIAAAFIVRSSNQKVEDIDGLGEVTKKKHKDAKIVAHF